MEARMETAQVLSYSIPDLSERQKGFCDDGVVDEDDDNDDDDNDDDNDDEDNDGDDDERDDFNWACDRAGSTAPLM